jgi:hypothetical protein
MLIIITRVKTTEARGQTATFDCILGSKCVNSYIIHLQKIILTTISPRVNIRVHTVAPAAVMMTVSLQLV